MAARPDAEVGSAIDTCLMIRDGPIRVHPSWPAAVEVGVCNRVRGKVGKSVWHALKISGPAIALTTFASSSPIALQSSHQGPIGGSRRNDARAVQCSASIARGQSKSCCTCRAHVEH
jgi:hypothetical protein